MLNKQNEKIMEAKEIQKQPTVQFMLEEYRNIAQTHDRLREVGMRLMYFFLVLSAFPFTLAGFLFQEKEFDLFNAPLSLHSLFLIVGVGIFILALALIDARLGQYRYARTVNEIRRYFEENDVKLKDFLYLPTDKRIPVMKNLGFVGIQLYLIIPIGAMYTALGVIGFAHNQILRCCLGFGIIVIYFVVFHIIRTYHTANYEKMIGR